MVPIESVSNLPTHWFCYQGVNTVFVTTSDLETINKLSDAQWDALDQWIENGGRLILSVAKNGEELLGEGKLLNRFCPGKFAGTATLKDNKRLESFAKNGQLEASGQNAIVVAKLDSPRGIIQLKQDEYPPVDSGSSRVRANRFRNVRLGL